MKRFRLLSIIALSMLFVSTGCERTPEDIEQWRNAKGGMDKMQEWASSTEEPKNVRLRAIEIMVEDGESNALQPTLKGTEDKKLRAEMVDVALPIVEAKWAKQDMPTLSEKAEGGRVRSGNSESVDAKDAAYFLHPFTDGEQKQKIETILAEWMSTDWQLRDQLGNTTLGQIAPRAGEKGVESLLAWLKEAIQPHTVVAKIKKHGDDDAKDKAAIIVRQLAEKAHPNLNLSLETAVLTFEHKELTPYLKQAVIDPNSPNKLIDGAMDALVRNEGERAAPFFSDLVKNQKGLLRWVAATRLVEVMGKPAFTYVATGLPVEMDSYPSSDKASLHDDTKYFCKMYQGEMGDAGISSVSDQIKRGLTSSRWPARMLALQCARIFKAKDLQDQISALSEERQSLPGWGDKKTVGDLADEVLQELSKS
jgi:RNase H-fold protein (predicted Holliday junction resolvase)